MSTNIHRNTVSEGNLMVDFALLYFFTWFMRHAYAMLCGRGILSIYCPSWNGIARTMLMFNLQYLEIYFRHHNIFKIFTYIPTSFVCLPACPFMYISVICWNACIRKNSDRKLKGFDFLVESYTSQTSEKE